ncbi:hypothetical protein [Janthinobacterium lividum]|uniref:hypothetical protein n=1 Tax=Janthinobacterium lividum TaxID=29581 RepID=UPI0008937CDB|nr:hypothetical protein [Janthinobacterium lividum]MCC7716695.1 hypothetical protein [Janthinobacterium lividum]OEZ54288.1 hypothetical protein JANLI_39500 [Janthinobacterium lividum]WQE31765.1 hypothetical protein U0004_29555 [Janthinobacterium lividum]STS86040.1 Uncharacterised protein [Janthinobacterium lividum]
MVQATAYCEEHDKNLTLEQARELYFAQPAKARKRFTFKCGDPKCRAILMPLVSAALYDREDAPGVKKRSPYFRRISQYPHITNCTWAPEEASATREQTDDPTPEEAHANASLGLLFKLTSPRASEGGTRGCGRADDDDANDGDKESRKRMDRPETSKFMATVAGRYLLYSEERRKNTPLSIEGKNPGTFYSVCMPLNGFHPHYQAERIYFGRVNVTELTNVFLVQFRSRLSRTGDKGHRTDHTEIKFLKRWLDENDRALEELLHDLATSKRMAWSFFYSEQAPEEVGLDKVRFEITEPAWFALIPENEIDANDEAIQD